MGKDYPAGASVWQELRVRSLDGLAEFYRAVLGLELEGEGATLRLTRGGRTVAGVVVDPQLSDAEIGWHVFLGAEDLDAAIARAVTAGASVLRADEAILASGRAARLRDPFGAPFGLAELEAGSAVPVSNELGFMSLVDPTNHDLAAQLEFQQALFPENAHDELREHEVCFFRNADGLALRGSYEVEESARPFLPPHWLPWFNVADQAVAVAAAAAAGGVVNTQDNVSEFGTWGVVVDPQGGVFKALQMAGAAL